MRCLVALAALALTLGSCVAEGPAGRADPTNSEECQEAARDLPAWRNFTPPTHSEGESTVMPIVFSDGTTAELVYPPDLDLASLGVSVLRTSGVITDEPNSARGIDIRYGAPPEIVKKGDAPIACYDGAHGQVEVWRSGWKAVPLWVFFPLHSWTAEIGDGNVGNFLSEDQIRTWATTLRVEESPDKWISIRPGDDLLTGTEYSGDVSLEFGNLAERAIVLWPIMCRENSDHPHNVKVQLGEVGGGQAFASWCDKHGPMEVHVYADEAFIRNVAANLKIRNVRHAADPAKYHIVP